MKTYLTYGLYLALSLLTVNLALFATGFHTDATKLSTASWIAFFLGLILSVTFILLGSKARGAQVPGDKPYGYGQALLSGFLISVFAGLFGIITSYLYMHVINPGFSDLMLQSQADKLEAGGMSNDQIEKMQSITRFMMNPVIQAVIGFLWATFFGLIVSLITAIFARRKDQPPVIAA